MDDLLENNKLIAEFMEFIEGTDAPVWDVMPYVTKLKDTTIGIPCSVPLTDCLLFHQSWDWLMPVVEKIENTITGGSVNHIVTHIIKCLGSKTFNCYIEIGRQKQISVTAGNRLQATYEAVVKFIKWYNENNKK